MKLILDSCEFIDITINVPTSNQEAIIAYHHKDPFEYIIIATSKINDATIVTSDIIFKRYGVEMVNSRAFGKGAF